MDASEVLVDELEKRVQQLREWIGNGHASDFSEYQKTVGEIKGLLFCRQQILDLKQQMEHSDDE